jgi:catechol 2,3-dioxygenase
MEFLVENAGFDLTEVQRDPEEDRWELVFGRYGDCHHDIAFTHTDDPDATLHHIAFTFPSFDQMKAHIDELARHDVTLESGVSRHLAGNNLFAYLWSPGGNRVELCTEMAKLAPETETVFRDETFTYTSWGGIKPPESFSDCT